MKVAYISGPYSGPTIFHRAWNIHSARRTAKKYWKMGYAVICPHSNTAFFDKVMPYETFIRGDIEILRRADVVIFQGNWASSFGSHKELEGAIKYGKKIYFESDRAWGETLVRRLAKLAWGDTQTILSRLLGDPSPEVHDVPAIRQSRVLDELRHTVLSAQTSGVGSEEGGN
mgnify:CR=1 FL=1